MGALRPSARPVRRMRARVGFTLLEVMLSLSLVLLLATVFILAFGRHGRVRDLEEGALRFEAALRLARAEAAGSGRRFCLVIAGGEKGAAQKPFRVLWEPEPLTDPGRFVHYWGSTWPNRLPSELVEVTRLDLMGEAAWRTLGGAGRRLELEGTSDDADVLLFEPDGTGDSCLIELAALDARDERRAVIELDGGTGKTTRRILTPTELETFYEQVEAEAF